MSDTIEKPPQQDDVSNHLLLDQLPRLTLFAEGIIGQTFHVLPQDDESLLTPGTTQRTIRLPGIVLSTHQRLGSENPDSPSKVEITTGAWRAMILQQLGPLLFGTQEFRLADRTPLREETGEIQGDLQLFFNTSTHPGLTRRLFYGCEAIRIDERVRAEYPGIVQHLHRLNQDRLEQAALTEGLPSEGAVLEAGAERLPPTASLIFEALLVLECNPHTDVATFVAPPSLVPLLERAAALRTASCDVYDSAELTQDLLSALNLAKGEADPTLLEELLEADLPNTHVAEMVQQEDAVAALEFDLFMIDEDMEMTPGEEPGSISIPRDTQGERDNLKRRIDMQRARMARASPKTDQSATRSFLYDEWDYLQSSYLRGWCRVFERELEPGDPVELQELSRRVGEHARQVRKSFEQIRPVALERIKPLEEGDEIYLDALIDHEIDRRTGRVTETRVYSTNTRKKREIATAFLVDLSASTDDAIPDPDAPAEPVHNLDDDDPYAFDVKDLVPEPPKRRIIDVQREALWLMSQALSALGDDFGIYGFSGYGRDEVEIFLVKELGQALTSRVLQTVVNMQPRRSTRMGPAIRHAVKKLRGREAGRRLLILVSDGFPQDCDYGPNRGDHEYGVQDTAKALLEAHAAGVETFCITVDTSGHDYLNRMCPEQRYMVIEEIEELPMALTKVYQRLAF